MDKIIGIYKITNPKGRVYIGQSSDILYRKKSYKYLKCKGQHKILNSLKKHGWDKHKFEIIHECDVLQLNELERYYQEIYNAVGKGGLNCMLTDALDKPRMLSEETKKKISKSSIGRRASEDAKKSMRDASARRNLTPELRKKFATMTGKSPSKENIQKLRNYWYGRKHTDESKEKMRIYRINNPISEEARLRSVKTRTGQKRSLETRDKISAALIGRKPSDNCIMAIKEKNSRLVLNTENGVFYNSLKEACLASGFTRSQLGKRINGKIKITTNFIYA